MHLSLEVSPLKAGLANPGAEEFNNPRKNWEQPTDLGPGDGALEKGGRFSH